MREADRLDEQVSFREIGPEDVEVLQRFLEENNVPSVVRTFNPFPMTSETAKRIACLPRRDRYYGAFLEDSLIGLAMLRGWDEGYSVPSFGIIIDHRFHGRHIGGLMLDYTINQAIQLNCKRMRLSVFASNRIGVRLYLSRGFVEDSRYQEVRSGGADQRIIMFKELELTSA